MTDIALDEKALEAAAHAAFEVGWPHERERQEQMERNPDTLAGYQKIVGPAIRAYLASPSQVAPQPQAGEARASKCPGADDPEDRCPRHPDDCTCWQVDLDHPTVRASKRLAKQPANPAQVGGSNLAERAKAVRGDLEAHNFDDVIALLDDYAARELWDDATNAVCQTMQERGMCNCSDGDCVAAKVEPAKEDIAQFLAAIGAGGQAVAIISKAEAKLAAYAFDEDEETEFSREDAVFVLSALSQPHPADERVVEALETYYARQIEWSNQTFGPAKRTNGILSHIRKELAEIAAKPDDLSEWVDVVILAMDGFWRHGGSASDLMPALLAKQQKNMARTWPDWRTMSEDSAIEHDRSGEAALSAKEGR